MLVRTKIGRYAGEIVDLPAHVARRLLLDGRAIEIHADAGAKPVNMAPLPEVEATEPDEVEVVTKPKPKVKRKKSARRGRTKKAAR